MTTRNEDTKRKSTPGRPRFGRDALERQVRFRLTPAQYELIEQEATRLNVGSADVIRAALDAYFDER